MVTKKVFKILWILLLGSALMGCQVSPASSTETSRLSVAATTSIVADIVRQVGGNAIEVHQVIPDGTDPHTFSPAPRDLSQISQVKLVFVNGAGLEETLLKVLKNTVPDAQIVEVSQANELLEGHSHENPAETEKEHLFDPHTWTDPNNVAQWVDIIVKELSQADPDHSEVYQKNGEEYKKKLEELDQWIQEQVKQIPENRRKLVTDHLAWGYFARRYGFEQIGAIIPGFSTLAEPSAQEIAALEDQIKALGIPAIFVSEQTNPALANRIAQDTGTTVVILYSGTLSNASGPAPTYIEYIRYNVNAIVNALK